jgi:hypothetical protein
VQSRAGRQGEQIDAAGGDVLAHLSRGHGEARATQLVVQFGVKQVHLAQVGLTRVARHTRAMLDGPAEMGVSLHAEPCEQPDVLPIRLGQRVGRARPHGGHDPPGRCDTWDHVTQDASRLDEG